jgi:polysaccharide biosynthesis/export protein
MNAQKKDGDSREFASVVWFIARHCCLLAIAVAFGCHAARAQSESATRAPRSELAQQNMNLVAASPVQIKAVLVQDAGLMVELKRWVAKDATDHGQIIGESDLTDDAIFDRLENDVAFRAVATQMVQRYGYLVPKVNPDSLQGKQQDLLLQERVKWIAQQEEEDRTQERTQNQRDLQRASLCSQGVESDCSTPQQNRSGQGSVQGAGQPGGPSGVPLGTPGQASPQQTSPPAVPSQNGGSLERAGLVQPEDSSNSDLAMLGLSGSGGAAELPVSSANGSSAEFANTLQRYGSGGNGELGSLGPLNSSLAGVSGSPLGSGAADWTDANAGNAVDTISPAHPYSSPVIRNEQIEQGSQRAASLEPTMVRARSPYRDIPSLYDMYLQATPHPLEPQRFGIDVFEKGTRDPQLIPMDLPAGPDYVVGPGDGLAIDMWGGVSQKFYRTVDREGRVSLPEVGPLLVSGKSLADVQESLQQTLRTQFRDVSAEVSLSRLRTIRVYEVGDVANPGAYDISSLSTPLNALFAAGGPTEQGSLRIVKHYRGGQLIEEVDLYDLLLHGVKNGIRRLENGDTVLVPPVGPQVTIEGMVRRPATYELKDEKNLSSVLELGGGLLPAATLRHIEVQRLVAHQKRTMLSLDIPETDNDAEVTKKLDSFVIQDGDRVRIYPIAPYNQDTVYLEGHVLRPGRYAYRENMRVTDLIASYKDLLPEPATQYAEIVRLNPPDFHPSVESFNVAEVMDNPSAAPALRPLDTVRIFSRFDFEDPPSVSVWGDVRSPGTYGTSGQIHLSDAVHLAGGLAPDAGIEDAQVFRYLPDGKSKIFSVNLNEALAGDPTENILLETRDRLLIHKSPDALQPATVYVQGEVGKPGRYPLTTNMTVADLILVGGGLKPSADTQTADLTHYTYAGADQTKLTGEHESVAIAAALSGDVNSNVLLHNGDVLTIRELSGWNDLGASITLKGEVKHPGTYGIRPGERLSSIIERAGGFQPDAYPYGAVLQRVQVRELEARQQDQMILRVTNEQTNLELLPDTDAKAKRAKETAMQQYQTTLAELRANPPVGRVTIRISSNISHWKNSTADIEVRAGDTLAIPKRPSYVMVTGQVFNPTAVSFRPGRSAKWYLSQSGGPTAMANKKAIFVVRADGSVIGEKEGLWGGNALGAALQPGDTVVVPEKAIGGGTNWENLFTSAQVASSIASTVFIALRY